MTIREIYESLLNGEDVRGKLDSIHAKAAKLVLRREAGTLCREGCVESVDFSPEGAEPWSMSIVFSAGNLSARAQRVLGAMKENAHRTEWAGGKGDARLTFYVYTIENREEDEQ